MERDTHGFVSVALALALAAPAVLAQAVTGAGVTDTMFRVQVATSQQLRLPGVAIGYPSPVFYLQVVRPDNSYAVAQVAFGTREQYVADDRLVLQAGVTGSTGPNETLLTLTATRPVTFELVLAGTVSAPGAASATGRAALDFHDDGAWEVDVAMGSTDSVSIPVNMPVGTLLIRTHTALQVTAGSSPTTATATSSVLLMFQAASYASIGSGCAGTAGVPAMSPQGGQRPWAGEAFVQDVTNLPSAPGTAAVGLLGASRTTWLGISLPADLSPLGMPGCRLYVSVDGNWPLVVGSGAATWSLPIPAVYPLIGAHFYQQVLVLDPNASGLALRTSNAGDATIGARNN